MPFKVLQDGATISRLVTTRTGLKTGVEYDVVADTVYYEGDYLADDEVSPAQQEALKNGEEPISSLLEKVTKKEYEENADESGEDFISPFQAEGGGPVDEPRKIRTALVKSDLETNKAEVLDSESANADAVESGDTSAGTGDDTTEVETGGAKRSATSGEVDEPRKNSQASTRLDEERNEAKAEVVEKA